MENDANLPWEYCGVLLFSFSSSVLNLKGLETLQLTGLQEIFIGLIIQECTGLATILLTGPAWGTPSM